MRAVAVLLASLLASAGGAAAEEKIDCAHTMIQPEMTECAYADYHKTDAALNAAYAKMLRALDGDDAALLRDSERKWIEFRDAECLFQAGGHPGLWIGGSMAPMIQANCLKSLTEQRIAQLRDDAQQ